MTASILAGPEGVIKPAAIKRSTRSLLETDQFEPDLRAANQSMLRSLSYLFPLLSIKARHLALLCGWTAFPGRTASSLTGFPTDTIPPTTTFAITPMRPAASFGDLPWTLSKRWQPVR